MVKLKNIITITLLKFCLFQLNSELINIANEEGFNLTNSDDNYFHDICLKFHYIKKDITLDYRRKYFYFPYNKEYLNITFQRPIRNDTRNCFFFQNTFSSIFFNLCFLSFFPGFIIQVSLLIICVFIRYNDSVVNTPIVKINAQKKKLQKDNDKDDKDDTDFKIKNSYSSFIPEVDIHQNNETLEPIMENPNNEQSHSNDNNNQKYNLSKKSKEIMKTSLESVKPLNEKKDSNEYEHKNKEDNIDPSPVIEKSNIDPSPVIEKSTDNYTFGLNFGTGYHFSNNSNINKVETKNENKEKKEDKIKRIQYVYEQINQNKRKMFNQNFKNSSNNINSDSPITISLPKNMEKIYTREEYFYFGYLLARIEDKRTIFQIYIDLLEQCQMIFKFFYVPMNIYEDRKLQIIYYLIKFNLYFLFNSLLIKSSVINDIYDNKNSFINDFYRSFKATVCTYIIGLFLYYLTNIKQIMIRRRYKLINIKINDARLNGEVIKFSMFFCLKFLQNKLILLFIVYCILFLYSFYITFSFCSVYTNTRLFLLKCVLLSITISQSTPLILCWIPAILRKLALKKKKVRLYDIAKYVELFYIPW